jgi:hypothetical protein
VPHVVHFSVSALGLLQRGQNIAGAIVIAVSV